jgi:hypothetical protein
MEEAFQAKMPKLQSVQNCWSPGFSARLPIQIGVTAE